LRLKSQPFFCLCRFLATVVATVVAKKPKTFLFESFLNFPFFADI